MKNNTNFSAACRKDKAMGDYQGKEVQLSPLGEPGVHTPGEVKNLIRKILIIAPPWIGDMVMTQALLRLLKKQDPGCSIDVFAIPVLHSLIKRMPEVDNCISSPFVHGDLKLIERFKVGKELRNNNYDQAYFIPNSLKSTLVPLFAHIPIRTGWRGEHRYFLINDLRILCKKKLPSTTERFVALGYPEGKDLEKPMLLPQLQISPQEQIDLLLKKLNISLSGKPILALCPGPEHRSSKRWPPEYFVEVAIAKKKAGWDIWLFGGPKEQGLSNFIQEKTSNICVDVTGKTNLGEAADLLSLATVVVANDSGLMHVASALHKPVVAIYGPTPPELAPPLTTNKYKMLSLNLACSPCGKTICPLGHNNCMTNLHSDLVLESIDEVAPKT